MEDGKRRAYLRRKVSGKYTDSWTDGVRENYIHPEFSRK